LATEIQRKHISRSDTDVNFQKLHDSVGMAREESGSAIVIQNGHSEKVIDALSVEMPVAITVLLCMDF
jgi:hypothetical protein